METINIHKNIVCYDGYDLDSKPELQDFLKRENLEKFLENIQQKVVLVLGGDRTMLSAVRENHQHNLPFLGLNFGTIGFLLNDRSYLEKQNNYVSRQYPQLEIRNNNVLIGTALNDISFYSPDGAIVEVNIQLKNNQYATVKGDGLIISTPAGSTAHNQSCNGPIIPHTYPLLVITPRGSKTLNNPKIISDEEIISIKNAGRMSNLGVNTDGNQILAGNELSLEVKKSQKEVEFLILENYQEHWDNKVLWEQGFNS